MYLGIVKSENIELMLSWTRMNGFPAVFYYNAKLETLVGYEGVLDDNGKDILGWIYQQNEKLRENS